MAIERLDIAAACFHRRFIVIVDIPAASVRLQRSDLFLNAFPPSSSCGRNAGVFELVMKVRDYELDQYCVVNNAVYNNYCQEARAEMFARCGINTQNIAKSGNAIATVEANIKYLAPLRVSPLF